MFQIVSHYFRKIIYLYLCLCVFSVFIISSAPAISIAGPDSGGGGGVLLINNSLILVDFLNILDDEDIITPKKSKYATFLKTLLKQAKPPHLEETPNKIFYFSRGDQAPLKSQAFDIANSYFTNWSKVNYDIAASLIGGSIFYPLKWQFVDQLDLDVVPRFYLPENLPKDNVIQVAAYYTRRTFENAFADYTVQINKSIWWQLSDFNRAGLIVHEVLRQVQIGRGKQFDDETLQKATAIMMFCKPSVILSQYLFFLIQKRSDLAIERFGSFQDITQECL